MGDPGRHAKAARVFLINVDGASRGNPGPSAAGWIIRDARDGQVLQEKARVLGRETNNRAEYFALIYALEDAKLLSADEVLVRSDSELLVKQMTGQYRVKNPGLKGLFARAQVLAGGFKMFRIHHVPRAENTEADAAANAALDGKEVG